MRYQGQFITGSLAPKPHHEYRLWSSLGCSNSDATSGDLLMWPPTVASIATSRPRSSCVFAISATKRPSSRSFALPEAVLAPGGPSHSTCAGSPRSCLSNYFWWSRHVRFQCETRSAIPRTIRSRSLHSRDTIPDPPGTSEGHKGLGRCPQWAAASTSCPA